MGNAKKLLAAIALLALLGAGPTTPGPTGGGDGTPDSHAASHEPGGADEISGVAPGAHAVTHEQSGTDEIDGDHLDIDFNPTAYVPDSSISEADNDDHLAAHLAGIDAFLDAGGVTEVFSESVTTDTTDSATDVLMLSMSVTPGAGDWMFWFSGEAELDSANKIMTVSVYVDGVQNAFSVRNVEMQANTKQTVALHGRVAGVNDAEVVDVRWSVSGGTGTMRARTFSLIKIES